MQAKNEMARNFATLGCSKLTPPLKQKTRKSSANQPKQTKLEAQVDDFKKLSQKTPPSKTKVQKIQQSH
jgi:hypothetical protein